jgi:hypothetical protein
MNDLKSVQNSNPEPDPPPAHSGALSRRKSKLCVISCRATDDTDRSFFKRAQLLGLSKSALLLRLIERFLSSQGGRQDIRLCSPEIERLFGLVNEMSALVLGMQGGKAA